MLHLAAWLALLAAIFVPLERVFALHPRGWRRPGAAADLGYYFLSGLVVALLLALPTSLLAAVFNACLPAGWRSSVAALPVGGRIGLILVVGELGGYAGHRLAHRLPCLWRFHAIHHSAARLDWLAHARAHPVDVVLVRLCAMLPVFACGLGQPSAAGVGPVAGLQVVAALWGFLIHANLRWRFGFLEQWLALPAFHHWHHVRSGPLDRNFASLLPVIDRLFGTLHLPAEWPPDCGTDTPVAARWTSQLVEPLLRPRPPAARQRNS